jgi:hypothetical protein
LLFVHDGKFQKNLLNNALIAVLIVYGEINVVTSASGINWIESDLGIWNSYAAAVSAIASPFVDIRRNYWTLLPGSLKIGLHASEGQPTTHSHARSPTIRGAR